MAPSDDDTNDDEHGNGAVNESVIRMFSRLAQERGAVNLSQGFPNEAPPLKLKLSLAYAVLSGQPVEGDVSTMSEKTLLRYLSDLLSSAACDEQDGLTGNIFGGQSSDILNQYSPPMGRPDLRQSISEYYERFYGYKVSPDDITITLGATEAFASALRTVGKQNSKCVIFEPFHELYPNQCKLFYLEPVFVTLRQSKTCWKYDEEELEEAMKDASILVLNSPHNPTGKVFTKDELAFIVGLCKTYDVYLITDEIYEHMCFGNHRHYLIPKEFPEMADRTLICNSLGKSASATGWRLGWCLHPPHLSNTYRGIHDQLAVMSPHPVQYATLSYLKLPDEYFESLAAKYRNRVQKLLDALVSAGFTVLFPEGAYYLLADYTSVPCLSGMSSMDAAMSLLELGVGCVPGDNFFGKKSEETSNKYLRFAACRSEDDLNEAIRRLKKLQASR
jgi:aspartate/methionine/tyrosine aminotransferase